MSAIKKREQERKRKEKVAKKLSQLELKVLDERKVVAYVRVSTDKQELEGYGLDAQINQINTYCNKEGITINKIYKDVISGSEMNRPAFNEIKEAIQNHEIKSIVTPKLDRPARNITGLLHFVDEILIPNKVSLISVDQNKDWTSPENKLMLVIMSGIAEEEKKTIKARTVSGRVQKFKSGVKAQGTVLGYTHNKKSKKWIIINEEKERVITIFRTYLQSRSLADLMKKLNENGIKSKRENPFKNTMTLHNILTNRFYIGYVRFTQKGSTQKEEQKGSHKSIISRELFGRVQTKLIRQKKT